MADPSGADQQFVMLRTAMREKIFDYIGRKQSSAEWRKRLPELAKRLEEILYAKFPNENDYYNMMKGPVEPQLQFAIKTLSAQNQHNQQNPLMSRQIASSSGYGTMIPTPGMTQGTSGNSRMAYVTDNSTLSSSGVGMVPQNANMGTSIQGSMSNGYQHLNNSSPQNSSQNIVQSTMGSVGVQGQLPHMIPTPGFSNQQNVPANPDYSNGTGYFNGESAVAPQIGTDRHSVVDTSPSPLPRRSSSPTISSLLPPSTANLAPVAVPQPGRPVVSVTRSSGGSRGTSRWTDMADPSGADQKFVMLRTAMREKIFEYIGRKQSSAEWRKRLPELAKRLEEILYTKFPNKNDYYNMMKGPVEPHLQFAIKTLSAQNQQNQQKPQMARDAASSSGAMIPDLNHGDVSEQSASLPADVQNNNADKLDRTE